MVTTAPAVAGAISLPPCVPKAQKLRIDSTHPDRVLVVVHERRQGRLINAVDYYVHPEWASPEDKTIATDGASEHRAWAWTGKESMHPHWAVRRLSDEDLSRKFPGASFNMAQVVKEITIMGIGGKAAITYAVHVPFLENQIDLPTGVSLICRAAGVDCSA